MNSVYRIKTRPKKIILVVSVIVLLMSWWWPLLKAHGSQQAVAQIEVQKGETLWDIAARYDRNRNTGRFVYELRKLNNLSDTKIFPGQTILVYIK